MTILKFCVLQKQQKFGILMPCFWRFSWKYTVFFAFLTWFSMVLSMCLGFSLPSRQEAFATVCYSERILGVSDWEIWGCNGWLRSFVRFVSVMAMVILAGGAVIICVVVVTIGIVCLQRYEHYLIRFIICIKPRFHSYKNIRTLFFIFDRCENCLAQRCQQNAAESLERRFPPWINYEI